MNTTRAISGCEEKERLINAYAKASSELAKSIAGLRKKRGSLENASTKHYLALRGTPICAMKKLDWLSNDIARTINADCKPPPQETGPSQCCGNKASPVVSRRALAGSSGTNLSDQIPASWLKY